MVLYTFASEYITFYKKDWREFNGDKAIEYFDEIVE